MIYSELLSRTSQQLTTDLADRKQHYDTLIGLLQVIPPELQLLHNNIREVLHFVPTIKNAISQLQHHTGSWFLHDFFLIYIQALMEVVHSSCSPSIHSTMVVPT